MNSKKESRIYLLLLIFVAVFAVIFVSVMGYFNYRTSAINLEEQSFARKEAETVTQIETAVGFGKSFEHYYGIDDVFLSFTKQVQELYPFIIRSDGELLYCAEENREVYADSLEKILQSDEFLAGLPSFSDNDSSQVKKGSLRAIFSPVRQEDKIIGYFGALYDTSIFSGLLASVRKTLILLDVIISVLMIIALIIYVRVIRSEKRLATHKRQSDRNLEKFISICTLGGGILLLSVISLYGYQSDYRSKIRSSVVTSLENLETTVRKVSEQGVDLRNVNGLNSYIEDRIRHLDTLRSVRISNRISEVLRTDETSDLITFRFMTSDNETFYLEAEISDAAIRNELKNIILILASTMIILLIFVLEINHFVDLFTSKRKTEKESGYSFSEKQISLSLRFTGFLCSTAEYICVPYAAMMIRENGESLFGLSVGMTAALPLTMEGLTQIIAMLTLPRFVKKYNIKATLFVSAFLMIGSNTAAFLTGRALAVIICRALAGVAYAGFKQVSNYLITRGYETEDGRSENILQDNAGLLAGATCGAGLGAILSANAGYAMTFLFSACVFFAYLIVTLNLIPWKALRRRADTVEERPSVSFAKILRMIFSPEMLFFIVVIGIPLNIGVMLCVTLIPAICQVNGISSVMLSYCYIANGIAGIYIGPALVAAARRHLGLKLSIALTFGLTAFGIFILHVPPIILMIVITSMILGFLDGFATPLATDRFMGLNVVKKNVDEGTALIFSVVLSYVLLTFAPMIAELMLLPASGPISPLMIGAICYAVCAALLILSMLKREQRT